MKKQNYNLRIKDLSIIDDKLKTSHGFTLLETIVAIAMISLAILGPLELSSKSIGSMLVSQNRITAFYLAQEGVEYVRNVRDNNFLSGSFGWLDRLDACRSSDGCTVDVPNYVPSDPSASMASCIGECENIKYDDDPTGGFLYYNYTTGVPTIFKRTVKIVSPVGINTDEARTTVTVSWEEKSGTKSIVLEENIFNWLP